MTVSDRSPALIGLTEPAEEELTGCLHLHDQSRTHAAQAYYDGGRLYAVHVPGFRPAIADRMLTAGLLNPILHGQVITAAGGDPRNEDIGHLAVRRGMIAQETLDAIHREILLSAITAITTWQGLRTRFRKSVTTTLYTVPAVPVAAVLTAVDRRATHWDSIWRDMAPGCPAHESVPRRTEQQFPVAIDLSPDARTLLSHIDGARSVDALAAECGLTRFETGHLLHTLTIAGLACVEPSFHPTFVVPPQAEMLPGPSAPAPAPRRTPAPNTPLAAAVSSSDGPFRPPVPEPTVKPVRRAHTHTPTPPAAATPSVTAPDLPATPTHVPNPTEVATLDSARAAYAAANTHLATAEQRASEAYTDHIRIAAVASDAQHAANQATRSHQGAADEELAANQALARAQASLEKAQELTTASARAARELTDRAASATNDADRARQRAHDTAAAVDAARDHLDVTTVDLARAQQDTVDNEYAQGQAA